MTFHRCRHCDTPLEQEVIDLGHQAPSNAYLSAEQLQQPELTYPLKVYRCSECWLVQLPAHAAADELFTADYAYFSSTSASWCSHAERYVTAAVERLGLDSGTLVVELASNDGYLLQYVRRRGIPCLGIEPTAATAAVARARGIDTLERFFGTVLAEELAQEGRQADLVVANNVLAHVPDINDFLAGITRLLRPGGQASIEFPHLLRLLQGNQFDTIYHEHYSYLSLSVLQRIAARIGLAVIDVEELTTHGGSLRVWMARQDCGGVLDMPALARRRVEAVLSAELAAGLETASVYAGFQQRAEAAKHALLRCLLDARERGERLLAYGAAAKGNTLLNYAGVRTDLLPAVADQATSKVGRFLPGSHIPVIAPAALAAEGPDTVLILPWNIAAEVKQQWSAAGYPPVRFLRAIPTLEAV